MPFALIIAGLVLLVSSARNTQSDLFTLVKGDFTGPNNFIYWTIAILLIGSLGYIPKLKPLSVGFITLVVIVLVLTRGNPQGTAGGFFGQFTRQIGSTQATAPTPAQAATSPIANSGLSLGSLPELSNFMIIN